MARSVKRSAHLRWCSSARVASTRPSGDAEAEHLILEAVEGLQLYDMRGPEPWALRYLLEFYRERGRDEEAAPYEARLAELASESTAEIA